MKLFPRKTEFTPKQAAEIAQAARADDAEDAAKARERLLKQARMQGNRASDRHRP